jgi:hypothetical protein
MLSRLITIRSRNYHMSAASKACQQLRASTRLHMLSRLTTIRSRNYHKSGLAGLAF